MVWQSCASAPPRWANKPAATVHLVQHLCLRAYLGLSALLKMPLSCLVPLSRASHAITLPPPIAPRPSAQLRAERDRQASAGGDDQIRADALQSLDAGVTDLLAALARHCGTGAAADAADAGIDDRASRQAAADEAEVKPVRSGSGAAQARHIARAHRDAAAAAVTSPGL